MRDQHARDENLTLPRFSNLHSVSEVFRRASPTHTGAIPSCFVDGQRDINESRSFTTCIYEGPFWVSETGELNLPEGEQTPLFLKSHAEINVGGDLPTPAGRALEDCIHIPLFRPGYDIYGHWLIDILPHLHVFLSRSVEAPFTVLLVQGTPKWAERLLSVFFEDSIKVNYIEVDTLYEGRLFLSTAIRDHDYLSSHSISLCNSEACPPPNATETSARNLYVARRKNNSGRILTNTPQLEIMLERFGFERLYPEDYSIEEQLRIFASAKCVIGEAGSGLHNSIFCPPDTPVFVIQSASQAHLIQSGLCAWRGQNVTYIWARAESPNWFAPFSVDLESVQTILKSLTFLPTPSIEPPKRKAMLVYDADGQKFGPVHYLEVMRQIDIHSHPTGYFEIGTETGASAAAFSCPAVCVDPNFKVSVDAIGAKPSIHFFQTPSDSFFANYDLRAFLPKGPDVCFLDGMHRYEFLLRDFIAIERLCHSRSSVLVHDCYPLNSRMALRDHVMGDETEDASTRFGWTGDVWKLIPILKQYRPDLVVHVLDAPPSGLLVIRNLDPASQILQQNYFKILEEMRDLTMEDYGIERLWKDYPFISSQTLLENPSDITTFFAHG